MSDVTPQTPAQAGPVVVQADGRSGGLSAFLRDYAERHRNPWNRALHVVGVPTAPVLFLYLLVRGRFVESAIAFVVGYTLQWLGHRIEGNSMWDSLEGKFVKAIGAPFRRVRAGG